MHYYPFHVGDYQTHTAHLSDTEDLAYRRMLDLYYINQKPLPNEAAKVARLIRMPAAVEEVRGLLEEFFVLQEGVYTNKRCDKEIASYMKQKLGGAKGAKAKWDKAKRKGGNSLPNGEGNGVGDGEGNAPPLATNNQNQNQNQNQQPIKSSFVQVDKPEGVTDEAWQAFILTRRAKKAPITKLAMAGIEREALAKGRTIPDAIRIVCERGWTTYKAEWDKQEFGSNPNDQYLGAL